MGYRRIVASNSPSTVGLAQLTRQWLMSSIQLQSHSSTQVQRNSTLASVFAMFSAAHKFWGDSYTWDGLNRLWRVRQNSLSLPRSRNLFCIFNMARKGIVASCTPTVPKPLLIFSGSANPVPRVHKRDVLGYGATTAFATGLMNGWGQDLTPDFLRSTASRP